MGFEISVLLLGLICISLIVLVVLHALTNRYASIAWKSRSPQLGLVKLVIFCNFPVLACAGWIAREENRGSLETFYMLLFAFLVFNGFAYAYFHFFNMSETARRIRMLLQIRQAGSSGLLIQQLESEYSLQHMIEARLERFVKMNQLTMGSDGRYSIVGRVLIWAGKIMAFWRRSVFHRLDKLDHE